LLSGELDVRCSSFKIHLYSCVPLRETFLVPVNIRHWVFVFHSMLDVRCSMLDVHLFINMFDVNLLKQLSAYASGVR